MSSSSKTRLQDSFHAKLQQMSGSTLEDTVSSVHAGQVAEGSSTMKSHRVPSAAISQRLADTRARSASPALQRSKSLLGLLVVQKGPN